LREYQDNQLRIYKEELYCYQEEDSLKNTEMLRNSLLDLFETPVNEVFRG